MRCRRCRDEQEDYFNKTAVWADVHPSQMMGAPVCIKSLDLLTLTLEELQGVVKVRGSMCCAHGARGMVGGSMLRVHV